MADPTRKIDPVRPAGPAAQPASPQRAVEVAVRDDGDASRTSPRMRFDVLQIAAWVSGLYLVVAGLVAFARAGVAELEAFSPVVSVGAQQLTPLYAAIWVVVGATVLAAGTGSINERGLRVGGVLLAVAGAVLLIEPGAFTSTLGVEPEDGTLVLAMGVLLAVASFVPPLSIRRPGVPAR